MGQNGIERLAACDGQHRLSRTRHIYQVEVITFRLKTTHSLAEIVVYHPAQ